jgi:AmmeMemoRadiSam system protein B
MRTEPSPPQSPWHVGMRLVSLITCLLVGICADGQLRAEKLTPFPALYHQPKIFLDSLKVSGGQSLTGNARVTGIVVPHHLVAADLISRAFTMASGCRYERLIILFPDHFSAAKHPFATTRRGFETAMGCTLEADIEAAEALLKTSSLVGESDLFEHDQGIQAVLPFAAHFFPKAKILPVALRTDSRMEDWRELVKALKPFVTDKTLVVQSTDYSHYLPPEQACLRDQETLNFLAVGEPDKIVELKQPDHLDSRAAQYVQMALQRDVHQAKPTVVANLNSRQYSSWPGGATTSYLLQVYQSKRDTADGTSPGVLPALPDDEVFLFAGDTFFGRHMSGWLSEPGRAASLRKHILSITGGAPLIVNLEGVMMPAPPEVKAPHLLGMPDALTMEWLSALNVKMVGLANNHTSDYGAEALKEMHRRLSAMGIAVLRHGESAEVGRIRVTALSDLSNQPEPKTNLIGKNEIAALWSHQARSPHIALMHWGREFDPNPGARELELMSALRNAGISIVVGAHPHVASQSITEVDDRGMMCAFSLGNFLFDQPGKRVSGALLEVRVFAQGTHAMRLHPLRNLYDTVKPESRN